MKVVRAAGIAAVGITAYSLYEPYRYRLTTHELELDRRCPDLTVLHVSDTHMAPHDRRLVAFLRSLARTLGEKPDLVVATGDFIDGDEGIEPLTEALSAVDARLGRFYVLGSHDYYKPQFQAYAHYVTRRRRFSGVPRADTARLERRLQARGWRALTNRTEVLETPKGTIRVAGVDDPYLRRHDTSHIGRRSNEVLAIGVVHTPDVVSEWLLGGFDLVVAGHTHGGQVRFPVAGALVTNCSLPSALACGVHRVGNGWLHVSPGLGTGRFAPLRFRTRPEATLLRLTPRTSARDA